MHKVTNGLSTLYPCIDAVPGGHFRATFGQSNHAENWEIPIVLHQRLPMFRGMKCHTCGLFLPWSPGYTLECTKYKYECYIKLIIDHFVICLSANAKAGPPPDRKLEGTIDVIGGSNSLSKFVVSLKYQILFHFIHCDWVPNYLYNVFSSF